MGAAFADRKPSSYLKPADVYKRQLLIDVVTHSVTGVTDELSDMIGKLPKDEQKRILNAVRALVD